MKYHLKEGPEFLLGLIRDNFPAFLGMERNHFYTCPELVIMSRILNEGGMKETTLAFTAATVLGWGNSFFLTKAYLYRWKNQKSIIQSTEIPPCFVAEDLQQILRKQDRSNCLMVLQTALSHG